MLTTNKKQPSLVPHVILFSCVLMLTGIGLLRYAEYNDRNEAHRAHQSCLSQGGLIPSEFVRMNCQIASKELYEQ